MKAQQIPRKVRDALRERSNGVCERCQREPATQAHHRRPRGAGGSRDAQTNTLANLLHLGNRCHAEVESDRIEAFRNGWLVRQGNDPRLMPVVVNARRHPQMLSEDGGMRDATPEECRQAGIFGPWGYLNSEDMGGESA